MIKGPFQRIPWIDDHQLIVMIPIHFYDHLAVRRLGPKESAEAKFNRTALGKTTLLKRNAARHKPRWNVNIRMGIHEGNTARRPS